MYSDSESCHTFSNTTAFDQIKVVNRFQPFVDLSSDNINNTNDHDIEMKNIKKRSTKRTKTSKSHISKKSGEKNNLVVNLSDKELTKDELNILHKGLKFCPTTKTINAGDKRREMDNFHNKLRTIQFFNKDNENTKENSACNRQIAGLPFSDTSTLKKLREKSNWKAPLGSASLETFININEISLSNEPHRLIKNQNITESERTAIRELSKNNEITIKPADKGGAVVIQNTRDYIKEANRQLREKDTYVALTKDPTEKFHKEVNEKLTKWWIKGRYRTK